MKNNKKILWANRGLCVLLGIWLSSFVVEFSGKDYLLVISIFGAGVCFLGFIHYYSKANDKQEKQKEVEDGKKESHGLLSKKLRIWDK